MDWMELMKNEYQDRSYYLIAKMDSSVEIRFINFHIPFHTFPIYFIISGPNFQTQYFPSLLSTLLVAFPASFSVPSLPSISPLLPHTLHLFYYISLLPNSLPLFPFIFHFPRMLKSSELHLMALKLIMLPFLHFEHFYFLLCIF